MCDWLASLCAIEERRVGDYILLEPIGAGSFASVWLARHTPTGAEVAVKVVQRQRFCDPFREVCSLQLLQHPNIVTLFEVITTEDELYLFQEHVNGGDLLHRLKDKGHMTEEDARHTFRQVISALQYCHQWHIVHRDLKPENILVDRENNVKVADFGFSAQMTQERPLLCNFCGTFPYMAPEVLQFEPHDEKVDVWSLGIVLYQMLTRKIPFEDKNHEEHKYNILSGQFPVPQSLSLECQELLKKLLTLDPDERPTLEDVMKDRWLNLGQAEELRPYREPPQGGLNPQIVKIMSNMGFEEHNIQKSVTGKKYDNIMGTYLILATTPKMKGCTVRVRSCPFPDPNVNLLPTQGVQASGQNGRDPAISPAGLGSSVPTPSPYQLVRKKHSPLVTQGASMSTTSPRQESKNKTPPASRDAMTTTPPTRVEERTTSVLGPKSWTATASPAHPCDPRGSPITHSTSTSRAGGAPEETTNENCLPAAHPDGGSRASSSDHSQGRQGVARRVFRCLLGLLCCVPTCHRPCLKRTRVKPI